MQYEFPRTRNSAVLEHVNPFPFIYIILRGSHGWLIRAIMVLISWVTVLAVPLLLLLWGITAR